MRVSFPLRTPTPQPPAMPPPPPPLQQQQPSSADPSSNGAAVVRLSSLLLFDPAARQAVARAHKLAAQSKSSAWRCAEATKRIAAGLQAAAEATEELRAALQGETLVDVGRGGGGGEGAASAGTGASAASAAAGASSPSTALEPSLTASALAAASQAAAQAQGLPSTPARAAVFDQLCDAAAQLQLVAEAVRGVCCEPLLAAQRKVAGGALLRREKVQRTERELCDVLQGYGRNGKKDMEKQRFENNMKVYNARRAYHHALLDYAVDLNAVTAEKRWGEARREEKGGREGGAKSLFLISLLFFFLACRRSFSSNVLPVCRA